MQDCHDKCFQTWLNKLVGEVEKLKMRTQTNCINNNNNDNNDNNSNNGNNNKYKI